MADKPQVFSINFSDLIERLKDQRNESSDQDNTEFGVRTTVFSVGKDPRVYQERSTIPELTHLEILKDGLQNYFVQLNWRIRKSDVDSGNIVAFNIYRRRIILNSFITAIDTPKQNTTRLDINKLDRLTQILQSRWRYQC